MENVVFEGSEAAVARINLSAPLSDAVLTAIAAHPAVLDASMVTL